MSKDNEPLEDEDERGVRDPELLADLGCRWIDGELILGGFFLLKLFEVIETLEQRERFGRWCGI
jgi:hypothetical protein